MRPIVLDVSRLLTGLRFSGPTGVETLELGLAQRLPPAPGLALTPWGARRLSATTRARIAAAATRRWREDHEATTAELAPISAFLEGRAPGRAPTGTDRSLIAAARFAPRLLVPAYRLLRDAATVHVGFFRLEQPDLFAFRNKRPDLRTIISFHDTLPLDHPEWFRPGEDKLHRARLSTALRLADAITVPATPVAEAIARHATLLGLSAPPVHVIELPVAPRFAEARPPEFGKVPYFLVSGTIEPRKNHAVLLEAWRSMGSLAPKLIIAGRRGWNNEAVFRALDAKPANILEIAGLSSAALATLTRGATALLSPSLDEGYGLPVAEALSAGTPVLAADTPIYRALWSARATLLDTARAQDWSDAVLNPPPRRAPVTRTDWPRYVAALTALAGSL